MTLAMTLVVTALACHAVSPAAAPAFPTLSTTPPRGYVPATRSAEECVAVKARTASLPLGSLDGLQPPVVRTFQMPPAPRGRKVEGRAVVILRVDETGRPMRDSIFITGATDQSYLREYVDGLRKNLYWPAVLDGCNVTARWQLTVELGPRR
jgi:hypothetical protein